MIRSLCALSLLLSPPGPSVSLFRDGLCVHVYFMNVGRACKNRSRSLFWKCCFFYLFIYSHFLTAVFAGCERSLMLHVWYALPGVRTSESPPPLLHLLWWSYCIRTALVSFRVEATETVDGFMALLWRDWASEERITGVLQMLMAAGQDWRGKRIGLLSVLLLIVLPSSQRWACWGAAYSCLRSSFSATATVSKTPWTGSRGEAIHFL